MMGFNSSITVHILKYTHLFPLKTVEGYSFRFLGVACGFGLTYVWDSDTACTDVEPASSGGGNFRSLFKSGQQRIPAPESASQIGIQFAFCASSCLLTYFDARCLS